MEGLVGEADAAKAGRWARPSSYQRWAGLPCDADILVSRLREDLRETIVVPR